MECIRIVHFLNQFFGQIGGEEAAGARPQIKAGAAGPGKQLQARLGEKFEIAATAICGDNTFAENPENTTRELAALIAPYSPNLVIAGPAVNSGRYGLSCGNLCLAIQNALKIPTLTAMHEENPAVEQFRHQLLILRTGASARHMSEALDKIAALAARIGRGEAISRPADSGCFPHGMKRPIFREVNAAARAIDMLLRKVAGEPYQTEVSLPVFDRVERAPLPPALGKATIALVTDGGLIARGNPERMPNGYTDRMTEIPVAGLQRFSAETVEVHHGGYDTQFVNADVNRLAPLDALRELEREGGIGRLHETVYSTAGLGMSLTNARSLGREIGDRLLTAGVQAVILTST